MIVRKPLFAAIVSTAFSSLAILIQARLTKVANPIALAAISTLTGGLILALINTLYFKKTLLKIERKQFKIIFPLIITRVVLGGSLFWFALSLTIGAKAIFFTKAEPYFILFWQWLLERKLVAKQHLFLLLLHFIGAGLLSVGAKFDFAHNSPGDLLLVFAVFFLALSYRFGATVSKELGALEGSYLTQLIGGLILLTLSLLFGVDYSVFLDISIFSATIVAALMWNVVGILFWFLALKELDAWIVSSLRALGPLFALPVAWFLQSERLDLVQLVGAAIVLLTSATISSYKNLSLKKQK